MSDDLISRQAAIDEINNICPVDTEYDCTLLDRVDVRYVLSELPSAQPDIARDIATILENEQDMRVILQNAQPERKVGKWIKHEKGFWSFVNDMGERDGWIPDFECSECGSRGYRMIGLYNFCPNCGAEMEVEE